MPTEKDYYDILGIDRNASEADIKSAYRKLAREHHPDMVNDTDKASAEKRFKEINEAYQVLSDPQKRKMYDQYGHAGPGFAGGAQGAAGAGPFGGFGRQTGSWGPFTYTYTTNGSSGGQEYGDFDPFDIFEDFFGFRGFRGRKPRKGKNLYYELHIDFKDAVFGLEKTVNVESGKVKIKIPAGVRNGTEIRFAGKGMPGPEEMPSGDLFLTIRYKLPKELRSLGSSLGTLVEIDMIQAALGTTEEILVVDPDNKKTGLGTAKLKIPPGTQSGTQIRVRGKGMPLINKNSRGDIIAQVIAHVPKNLSKKQKKILEEYRETLD